MSAGQMAFVHIHIRSRGNLAVAIGGVASGSEFQLMGNGSNGNSVRNASSLSSAERVAINNPRARLYENDRIPARNEQVMTGFDPGFAAR